MTLFLSVAAFEAALEALPTANEAARAAASLRQGQLTKPPGSLGRLEDLAVFMAGWQGRERPRFERARVAIFAGNHGVAVHGVSAFPVSVTAQMVENFRHGGAAINALADAVGLELIIADIDLETPTADFTTASAMDETACLVALNIGADVVVPGLDMLVVGEMGIGNSTSAAALCLRSYGGTAADWVGPGTGVDVAGIARKTKVVEAGIARHDDFPRTPFETLRRVGGREIVATAGAVVAARLAGVPVVLDGFISSAAIAPIAAAYPGITEHCIAGHCSAEPGHERLLQALKLEPLLRLGMRLGEGSGAAVAVGVIRSALAAHDGMATFAEAGVSVA